MLGVGKLGKVEEKGRTSEEEKSTWGIGGKMNEEKGKEREQGRG